MSNSLPDTGSKPDVAGANGSRKSRAANLARRYRWIWLPALFVLCAAAIFMWLSGDPATRLCRACYDGKLSEVRRLIEAHPELMNVAPAVQPKTDPEPSRVTAPTTTRDALRNEWLTLKAKYLRRRFDAFDWIAQEGGLPLHFAASKGRAPVVELLLSKGADANSASAFGTRPLHLAAGYGNRQTVELLLAKGADPKATTKQGDTALHYSAIYNNRATAEVLLKAGANIHATDSLGLTPLGYAQRVRVIEMTQFLQKQEAQ